MWTILLLLFSKKIDLGKWMSGIIIAVSAVVAMASVLLKMFKWVNVFEHEPR
jgi:hypothetical protein